MLRKISYIIILMAGVTAAQINQAPIVSNVTFSQRGDGSFIVDIYYDVIDYNDNIMTVTVRASSDAGATWDFACNLVSGDVGEDITSGNNKHIEWDFGAEHAETFGDQFMIKIIADDGENEGVYKPCPGLEKVYFEGGPFTDEGGNYYVTVQIDDKCWMRENLNVGVMINSDDEYDNQINNSIVEKYCYNNNPENCDSYGGLYQWNEAMQYITNENNQGICPFGWRIPTLIELESLESISNDEAAQLVAVGQTTTAYAPTNETGFSALLVGYRQNSNGAFYSLHYHTNYWSSTQFNSAKAYEMGLTSNNISVYFNIYSKYDGYSIRCIKD
jgi:uncharacterized protein (TIGR02145 family)